MTIQQYIDSITKRYKLGNSTEHTFRGDLQQLIESIVPAIRATNEPKRQSCGAPDFIITKKDIPIGFIEAKDIGDPDLAGEKKTGNKEQFDRYKTSLNNIIFTDYLDFHFYQDSQRVMTVNIAKLENSRIVPLPDNFLIFKTLIEDFCKHIGQTIKSPKKIAEMMAGKARLLSDVIERALTSDENNHEDSTLKDQMTAFKQILIHDITPKGFADVYAQTIVYGMFAARLHDPSLDSFSRQEAAELIPKSNPFLRKLFGYIAGPDIDDRIKWIVDSLVEIFLACNVKEILSNFGRANKMEDPIIHFYETFLSEYDPKLRKARGVWYTPPPVVKFIVRAVDDILKTEFGMPQGLADNSKIKVKINVQGKTIEQEVHKVQILDPATGTGTFLAEVVKHIHSKFKGQQGIWSNYVETHLLPRLNGFELLMASYAMAHLKLDLLLTETGYTPTGNQRFRVYLTNSLEESHPETGTLFANWLSNEAREANEIKRDTPVMVVMGNPPYAVSSSNKSEWIQNLIAEYKKNLNERKINLDDDYIKFIRFGQHYIDKNGSGILAYISNNSFIDGITHRQMRKHLLESFDKIYILDLHGNAKKKEVCPDGSPDQNVFDIMQGVSINIFVKTGGKKKSDLGVVFHTDLYGSREYKYETLIQTNMQSIQWKKLEYSQPNMFFVPKNFNEIKSYEIGFKLDDLININSNGIETQKDIVNITFNEKSSANIYSDFCNLENDILRKKYALEDGRDWKIQTAKADLINNKVVPTQIQYRPFDYRFTNYTGKSKGIMAYPRNEVMKHLFHSNYGICLMRQYADDLFTFVLISKNIIDNRTFYSNRGKVNIFPLYLYPESTGQVEIGQTTERTPNLNSEIVNQISEKLGMTFVAEKSTPSAEEHGVHPSTGGELEQGKENSPPLEGYAKRGVVKDSQSNEAINTSVELEQGKENSPPLEGYAKRGVVKDSNTSIEILTHINGIPIKRNFVENLPYNIALEPRAKELRKAGILSEVLFWKQVNKGNFYKIDFDRQRIIGNYIVDFYVKALGLIVEIDGSSHDEKTEYDAERQAYLESLNLKVYRISDLAVKKDIGAVMEGLEEFIVESYGLLTTPSAEERGVHPSKGGELNPENTYSPIDILDYIYAVLHSPAYREKYKEFLKIDFPRVPYPKDKNTFWSLVKLGSELRQIHLLESPAVENFITQYPVDGDNKVTKIKYQDSKVFINETQYFANVPETAWTFFIGGYQPAQKWLKDRKDRSLEFNDILHYQKIIVALSETNRLMQEIDKIEIN